MQVSDSNSPILPVVALVQQTSTSPSLSTSQPKFKCSSYTNVNFDGHDFAQSFVSSASKCCETYVQT